MRDIVLGRRYKFRGQHHLPGFPEPYCTPHEHLYTVELIVISGVGGDLVRDDLLDEAWQRVAPWFPRGGPLRINLNAVYEDTTVEGLANTWFNALRESVPQLAVLTVWEDDERFGRVIALDE